MMLIKIVTGVFLIVVSHELARYVNLNGDMTAFGVWNLVVAFVTLLVGIGMIVSCRD